ncbi:MAG: hypothetical protein V9E94_04800 [Microthrixaceae bacterium]
MTLSIHGHFKSSLNALNTYSQFRYANSTGSFDTRNKALDFPMGYEGVVSHTYPAVNISTARTIDIGLRLQIIAAGVIEVVVRVAEPGGTCLSLATVERTGMLSGDGAAGDPVITASGSFWFDPTEGEPLGPVYSSSGGWGHRYTGSPNSSAFGAKWSSVLDEGLSPYLDGVLRYRTAGGVLAELDPVATDEWGGHSELMVQGVERDPGDGTYEMTFLDGGVASFASSGRLIRAGRCSRCRSPGCVSIQYRCALENR